MTWLQDAARKLGDDMNAVLVRHEEEKHDGEPCPMQMVNLFGYLAHRCSLLPPGLSEEDEAAILALFLRRVHDYRAVHEEHILSEDDLR